jgi:hypothetical protein
MHGSQSSSSDFTNVRAGFAMYFLLSVRRIWGPLCEKTGDASVFLLPSFFVWSILLLGLPLLSYSMPAWLGGILLLSAASMMAVSWMIFAASGSRVCGSPSSIGVRPFRRLSFESLLHRPSAVEPEARERYSCQDCTLCSAGEGERSLRLRCASAGHHLCDRNASGGGAALRSNSDVPCRASFENISDPI